MLWRKYIEINIIDDEEYEKKENFYVILGEPKCIKSSEDDDSGAGTEIGYNPDKERIEELGKPKLSKYFGTSKEPALCTILASISSTINWYFLDPFKNDITHRKALKSVSFVLNEFSQMANVADYILAQKGWTT